MVCHCFECFFVVVLVLRVVKSLFGMKPKLPVRPIKFMTNLRVEENKQEIYNTWWKSLGPSKNMT